MDYLVHSILSLKEWRLRWDLRIGGVSFGSSLLLLSQVCWFRSLIFNKPAIQQTCMEVRSVPYQEHFRNETKGPLERTNVKHGLIIYKSINSNVVLCQPYKLTQTDWVQISADILSFLIWIQMFGTSVTQILVGWKYGYIRYYIATASLYY